MRRLVLVSGELAEPICLLGGQGKLSPEVRVCGEGFSQGSLKRGGTGFLRELVSWQPDSSWMSPALWFWEKGRGEGCGQPAEMALLVQGDWG